ncbi:hypothetical protein [Azospira inquinata]|uniref:Uncharacterized protein n=1 Tax=Azospira inquinata TaxID=2785627 RepID=A0A975XVT8_9RHOO|nr:hypothetical protein [Azospira inquinata]QWT47178.1 hypothetical protein J8L76_05585 [Azospira inquinata]QWT50191.1 hypothetical protein Azoinq_06285 [Azospira inquinata]
MALTAPVISGLTPDERSWRIDWLGDVAYPPTVNRRRQPSIRIAISPTTSCLLFNRIRSNPAEQRDVWLPIGLLPLLRVGDIWTQGKLTRRPTYDFEQFPDQLIYPDTVSVIKAGLPCGSDYLLPFNLYPWHQHHTQSHCLLITRGIQALLIPCMELIRFYFGSSSQLLQRLWSGPITPEKFWSVKQYESEIGHLHLKLADGISKASAADIGRMAMSEYAWKKADSLYRYCAQEAADGLPGKSRIYPIMGFPFQGRTSLTAVGTWLPYLGRPRSLFVVSHLRQCTHPFPFRSLSYELGRPLVRRPSKTSPEGASPADQEKRKTALVTRAAHQSLGDDDPGRGKSLLSIEGREGDRFPDLTHKPLWEEYKVRFGNVDVFVHRKSGLWEQVGFGTPEGNSETRAVEASVSVRQSVPPPLSQDSSPLPHWLKEGIERKCKELEPAYPYHPVKVERIVLPGRMEALFPLPLVVDEDGVIDSRGMYRGPDDHERPRLACLVRFSGMKNCVEPVIMGFVEGAIISAPCSEVQWLANEKTGWLEMVQRFLSMQ